MIYVYIMIQLQEVYVTTAIATWLATAMLHRENKDRDSFQIKEIFQKIRHEDLIQTRDNTLMTHITVHCVANTKSWTNIHRKLYRVSTGRYRLYKDGDDYHPSREGGQSAPSADEVPANYRNLIELYHSEYNTGPKPEKPKSIDPIFTLVEEGNRVKVPSNILERLDLKPANYLAFVENASGEIVLKKARLQVD